MKIRILFFPALLLFFASAFLQADQNAEHRDQDGFLVQYPSDWRTRRDEHTFQINFSSDGGIVIGRVPDNRVRPGLGNTDQLNEMIKSMFVDKAKMVNIADLEAPAAQKAGAESGAFGEYLVKDRGGKYTVRVWLFEKGPQYFMVIAVIKQTDINQFSSALVQIVDSFRIITQDSTPSPAAPASPRLSPGDAPPPI